MGLFSFSFAGGTFILIDACESLISSSSSCSSSRKSPPNPPHHHHPSTPRHSTVTLLGTFALFPAGGEVSACAGGGGPFVRLSSSTAQVVVVVRWCRAVIGCRCHLLGVVGCWGSLGAAWWLAVEVVVGWGEVVVRWVVSRRCWAVVGGFVGEGRNAAARFRDSIERAN